MAITRKLLGWMEEYEKNFSNYPPFLPLLATLTFHQGATV